MADALEAAAAELRTLEARGVQLARPVADHMAELVTTDKVLADEHHFERQGAWDDEEDWEATADCAGLAGGGGNDPAPG